MTDIYGGDIQSIESTVTADGSGKTVKVEIDQVSFRDWGLTSYSYYDGFELAIASETASAPATAADTAGVTGQAEDANTRTASARTDRSASRSCRAKRTNQPHSHHVGRVDHHKLGRVPAEGAVTGYQILRRRPTEGERRLTRPRGEHWQHRHKLHRRLGDQRREARLPRQGRELGRYRITIELRQGHALTPAETAATPGKARESGREAAGAANMVGTGPRRADATAPDERLTKLPSYGPGDMLQAHCYTLPCKVVCRRRRHTSGETP